jgi:hypothetical protein
MNALTPFLLEFANGQWSLGIGAKDQYTFPVAGFRPSFRQDSGYYS